MKKLVFLLFILVFLLCYCQRIDQSLNGSGSLHKITIENLNGIPLDYGKLISVTTHAQYEGWSQLWFVDSTNTIRMVRVQFHNDIINPDVLVIPRN
jgi:hypothetical protein